MLTCPSCGGGRVGEGAMVMGGAEALTFRPGPQRFFSLSFQGGVCPEPRGFRACLDCGHLWARLDPDELRRYIREECTEATQTLWGLADKPTTTTDELS